jgi:hypothetical protein
MLQPLRCNLVGGELATNALLNERKHGFERWNAEDGQAAGIRSL